eukprot:scaffold58946_cov63-Phaeocystis_antarctica.AAC.15
MGHTAPHAAAAAMARGGGGQTSEPGEASSRSAVAAQPRPSASEAMTRWTLRLGLARLEVAQQQRPSTRSPSSRTSTPTGTTSLSVSSCSHITITILGNPLTNLKRWTIQPTSGCTRRTQFRFTSSSGL